MLRARLPALPAVLVSPDAADAAVVTAPDAWSTAWAAGMGPAAGPGRGEVCNSRPGMKRASTIRNRQICATCVPVVMWTQ